MRFLTCHISRSPIYQMSGYPFIVVSDVTGSGAGGGRVPPDIFTWKFLLTYRENRGKGKGGKERKRRKIVKGKVEK